MICHRSGPPPISIIGFGLRCDSSEILVPKPPARITAFIGTLRPDKPRRRRIPMGHWAVTIFLARPGCRATNLVETQAALTHAQAQTLAAEPKASIERDHVRTEMRVG